MVKEENSNKRDNRFNLWHRDLVRDWYMQDIDVVMWQLYDKHAKTVALIEEKRSEVKSLDLTAYQFEALRDLAGPRPLFSLLVNHDADYFSYYLVAANNEAKKIMMDNIERDKTYLSEFGWMKFEAFLRRYTLTIYDTRNASRMIHQFKLPEIKNF